MAFFFQKIWSIQKKAVPLHSLSANEVERAFSSAGLEHLPYKQRVGGSNPSTPTTKTASAVFFFAHLSPEKHAVLPYQKTRKLCFFLKKDYLYGVFRVTWCYVTQKTLNIRTHLNRFWDWGGGWQSIPIGCR